MRTIQTPRLRLVPVREENADVLWRVLQEPDLRDFQDLPSLDVEQFRRAVAARPGVLQPAAAGRFEWLIYELERGENANGKPVGWVSLRVAERTPLAGEIGYSVRRPFRERGIASEAVAALVNEGFERARLSEVRAYCVPENQASRGVLRRNGFREQGVVRHGATVQGQPVDVIAYGIDRKRWERQTADAIASRPAIRS